MKRAWAWVNLIRNIIFTIFGLWGIFHQEWTGHVSVPLIGAYLAILGIPFASGLTNILKSQIPTDTSSEHEASSPTSQSSHLPSGS